MASLVLASSQGFAWAAPSDPQEDALNRQGVQARRKGDDQRALELFQHAYELHHSPRAAAQMGLAEIALGRWEAADDHLDEALAASPDAWIKKNQGTLREASDGVKAQFGAIQVLGEPSGADVVIDGRVIGKLPMAEPARVRPGEYRLEVRAAGYLTARRDVSVSARALRRETLTLVVDRGPVAAAGATAPDTSPDGARASSGGAALASDDATATADAGQDAGQPTRERQGAGNDGTDAEGGEARQGGAPVEGPHLYLSFQFGSGFGIASGEGDLDPATHVLDSPRFAPAQLGHLAPEIGVMVNEHLIISARARLQYVNLLTGKALDTCAPSAYCRPSPFSPAGFLRATHLWGTEGTRPFAALEVGYGYIKHGVLFSGDKTCGISGDARCLEAVSGGPYLAGATFGVLFEVVRSFGFLLSASAQLGLPKFTVNLDANAGVAMRF